MAREIEETSDAQRSVEGMPGWSAMGLSETRLGQRWSRLGRPFEHGLGVSAELKTVHVTSRTSSRVPSLQGSNPFLEKVDKLMASSDKQPLRK